MNPSTPLSKFTKILPDQAKALARLGLSTIEDLLYFMPVRYSNVSTVTILENADVDTEITVYGILTNLKTMKGFKSKIPMATATFTDIMDSSIPVTWMHQPYLAKMFKDGEQVKLTGKVSVSKSGKKFMNPVVEKTGYLPVDMSDSLFQNTDDDKDVGFPVYHETRGITSKWMYHTIQKIFKENIHTMISDPLPEKILKQYKLPDLKSALVWVHFPEKKDHADAARKRFAFQEIFLIQLQKQFERKQYEELFSYELKIPRSDVDEFISRFPFEPTGSQMDAIESVLKDFQKDVPMSRLIEGDVGSGKTFVAATVSYAVIMNRPAGQTFGNLQVAYMAPTEVLATQLFESFIEYFKHTGISIGLITGSGCRKFPTKVASAQKPWTEISRTQLLKWVKNGEIAITIGTHALISKSVDFKDLGLVIIDEQHRFGTNQRMKLAKKEGHAPHYLSMTATPIPRTLALTVYGDLDLSVIDQMPSGRKPVITEIVSVDKRDDAYESIRKELEAGRQAYIICPRISDPDEDTEQKLNLRSVTSEAKRLSETVFKEYEIGIMHSKMTPKKKEEVMAEFSNHEIDILVSTSVVEVGVNVPNATNIIIEGSERFGLAQLHQLRGRVIRGNHQAYCYLFADTKTEKTIERLKAFVSAKNGFELAELDLAQRGAGDLAGVKQWGVSDLAMHALRNIKLVEYARNEAKELISIDSQLQKHPLLLKIVQEKQSAPHME
jgi:ATP-dependent DNA helicase RecG